MKTSLRLLSAFLIGALLAAQGLAAAWQAPALERSVSGMVASLPEPWRPEVVRFLSAETPDPGALLRALADPKAPAVTAYEQERGSAALKEKLGRPDASAAIFYDHAERMQVLEAVLSKHLAPETLPQVRIAALLSREAVPAELRPRLESRMRAMAGLLEGYQARPAQEAGPAIESAAAEDLPALRELERRTFPRSERWLVAQLREVLSARNASVRVIRARGGLAADSFYTQRAGRLYIENLATHPDHRGRGYASALLREAFAAALDNPAVRTIALHVAKANKAAVALYEKFGFSVARRVSDHYGPGKDALYMTFTVRPPAAKAPALFSQTLTEPKLIEQVLLSLKTSTPGKLDGARVMIKYRAANRPTEQAKAEAAPALKAGLPLDVFTGVLTTVARNKKGQLYFRMTTLERTSEGRYLPRAFNLVEGRLEWLKVLDEGSAPQG